MRLYHPDIKSVSVNGQQFDADADGIIDAPDGAAGGLMAAFGFEHRAAATVPANAVGPKADAPAPAPPPPEEPDAGTEATEQAETDPEPDPEPLEAPDPVTPQKPVIQMTTAELVAEAVRLGIDPEGRKRNELIGDVSAARKAQGQA